ncbi:hypothetical protein AB0I28_09115 [Phytomonospora sp. NPDC050363]|uniref:hypothetical protein n=1 Tax=Phytomonospora sp. NPDC050363 TaxID=3155642 RepID=UPI0033C51CDD
MPERRLCEMIHTYTVNVPDEGSARALAADLARRGHRFVRVRATDDRHLVESLVDEPAADSEWEWAQAEHESVAVAALARQHGGYHRGGMVSQRTTALETFGTDNVAHALDAAEAHDLRDHWIARLPTPVPAPEPLDPLSLAPCTAAHPPLFETLRAAAPADSWWRSEAADGFAEIPDVELVFELYDAFMHQGTCYPHTASEVPLLAALAARDDVHPGLRAILVDFLFLAATVGCRLAAADADRRDSLGLPHDEDAGEVAAREAVEACAPALFDRWDHECEAVRFSLALLAAACPDETAPVAEIRAWADAEGDSPRAGILRLTVALADDDPAFTDLLARLVAAGYAGSAPAPAASSRGTAFSVLEEWAEQELSAVLEDVG